jgi:hypothetical protein
MRRILLFLVVVVALALYMAVPAFAVNHNANCVGQHASVLNKIGKLAGVPGLGGATNSYTAKESGGMGQFASSNCS